jgi:two-component system alkaline phosphatase synthesis response regulator PhoP
MKIKQKILLVDDDPDIREFMSYNLKKEGHDIYTVSNGYEALGQVDKINPNLIILDIMMPAMSGIEVCKKIRENKKNDATLICFLTAKGDDYSQIEGFEAGGDDYVTKPISPDVFIKKISALLRRFDNKDEFTSGELHIDFKTHTVNLNSEEIIFAKKEFALLKLLISNPGKVFTRDEIYKSVWGDDIVVGDRTIDVHIRKLREKLGDKYIKTLKGIGYKFEI